MNDLTLFTAIAAGFGLLFVLLVIWQWSSKRNRRL